MASSRDVTRSPPLYATRAYHESRHPFETNDLEPRGSVQLQDLCVAIAKHEISHTTAACTDATIEIFHGFVRHALLVDYLPSEFHGIDEMIDRRYIGIASNITDLRVLASAVHDRSNTEALRCRSHAIRSVEEYVQHPARHLAVPVHMALIMVVRYASNLSPAGTYNGCIQTMADASRWGSCVAK